MLSLYTICGCAFINFLVSDADDAVVVPAAVMMLEFFLLQKSSRGLFRKRSDIILPMFIPKVEKSEDSALIKAV